MSESSFGIEISEAVGEWAVSLADKFLTSAAVLSRTTWTAFEAPAVFEAPGAKPAFSTNDPKADATEYARNRFRGK